MLQTSHATETPCWVVIHPLGLEHGWNAIKAFQ